MAKRAKSGKYEGMSKSDAIRAAAKSLGKSARPVDVRNDLATNGVSVSSVLVSGVLRKTTGLKAKPAAKASGKAKEKAEKAVRPADGARFSSMRAARDYVTQFDTPFDAVTVLAQYLDLTGVDVSAMGFDVG